MAERGSALPLGGRMAGLRGFPSRGGLRRQAGLTLLLETLLGLALITVALLCVFSLFPIADAAVTLSSRTAQATQVGRRIVEKQLAIPYDEVAPFTGAERVQHTVRRGETLTTRFVYEVDVVEVEPPRRLKDVTVTVSWVTGSGPRAQEHTVRLETLKGDLW